jgi:TM2 domain-containing membrane protein YozV
VHAAPVTDVQPARCTWLGRACAAASWAAAVTPYGEIMIEPYRADEPVTLGANRKHCYACATILDVRAELCPRCGVRQPGLQATQGGLVPIQLMAPVPATTKSKTSAALLALFLGGIGIHKFYLGSGGMGVLYLLFCWTFIPSIIAFIEALMLFGMSEQEFARKYPG